MSQRAEKVNRKFSKNWKRKIFRAGVIVATFSLFIFTFYFVSAATNISSDSAEHWAWSDIISWINFYETDTVTVTSQRVTGYASSSLGDISLDCATTRSGNICGTSDYYVVNDGNGNLSGWGWNDAIGWISFYCGNIVGACSSSNYRVLIDPTNGDFSGYAWNEVIGWISFNCTNHDENPSPPPTCITSTYKVKTNWFATSTTGYVFSSVFNTGVSGGAQINSVLWQ